MARLRKHYKLKGGNRQEPVTLAWDASIGATGYRLYRGDTPTLLNMFADVGNVLTYTHTPTVGTWYFAVRAYNSYGDSPNSNVVGGGF